MLCFLVKHCDFKVYYFLLLARNIAGNDRSVFYHYIFIPAMLFFLYSVSTDLCICGQGFFLSIVLLLSSSSLPGYCGANNFKEADVNECLYENRHSVELQTRRGGLGSGNSCKWLS